MTIHTRLVTLNILSRRSERSTLTPKDAPVIICAYTTSKRLPTTTCYGGKDKRTTGHRWWSTLRVSQPDVLQDEGKLPDYVPRVLSTCGLVTY